MTTPDRDRYLRTLADLHAAGWLHTAEYRPGNGSTLRLYRAATATAPAITVTGTGPTPVAALDHALAILTSLDQ